MLLLAGALLQGVDFSLSPNVVRDGSLLLLLLAVEGAVAV